MKEPRGKSSRRNGGTLKTEEALDGEIKLISRPRRREKVKEAINGKTERGMKRERERERKRERKKEG